MMHGVSFFIQTVSGQHPTIYVQDLSGDISRQLDPRKITALATSSGVPPRFSGMASRRNCLTVSSLRTPVISVSMKSGAIALQRGAGYPNSRATDGEADYPGLGSGIIRLAGISLYAYDARNIDNAALLLLKQLTDRSFGNVESRH